MNAGAIAAAGSRVSVAHLDWAAPPILEAPVNDSPPPESPPESPPDSEDAARRPPARPAGTQWDQTEPGRCTDGGGAAWEGRVSAGGRAAPPPRDGDADALDAQLRCQADVLLAADVINDEGLSEMVERIISLYLAPDGVFVMVAPRPRHRHKIDVLRGLLLGSDTLRAEVVPVPDWLREGIEEAEDIEHELYLVQRSR